MTQRLCVASVPAGHPYIARTLAHPDVFVLPDPRPVGAPVGQWWPPVMLTPGWIEAHEADADLLHLHFGTESFSADALASVVEAAHAAGWAVVQTVHDLENPQLAVQTTHLRQLDTLIPLADGLVTLTPGAAAEIERRWGRTPTVLPHPRLLADGRSAPRGLARTEVVVGTHLKDLRPNVDGPATVRALIRAVDGLRSRGLAVSGEVRMHRSVRDEGARDLVRDLIAQSDSVVLLEHERLDDQALASALAHLDACVLPYRSGTHSGWLELCWDLGVPVAAPAVGYFGEQHVDPTIGGFALDGAADSLLDCLVAILRAGTRAGSADRFELSNARLAQRDLDDRATTEAQVALYRDVLAREVVR